ncbi:MAG: tetratricopeptide repeat protein, partial [Proteobacteria bacterium]|nr:tetratricopeptide repeat protein [Pseudomonadota bacterium]
EGSVRRAGDQVRITVQLINAPQDKHVWSDNYDRGLADIFAIQDEVARQVAAKLQVQFQLISEGHPTDDLAAYEHFLAARELANSYEPAKIRQAIDVYDQALARDPEYADAWAGQSLALGSIQFSMENQRNAEARARVAAEQALALNPDSWLSNLAMANFHALDSIGEFDKAEPYFRKAIELNPNDAMAHAFYGFSLWLSGRAAEATPLFIESYRRSPRSAEANLARAVAAVFVKDYATARVHLDRALTIGGDRSFVQWWVGVAHGNMQDKLQAARHFARALDLEPAHTPSMFFLGFNVFKELGDLDAASHWLSRADAIDPSRTQVLWRRAEVLMAQNRIDDYVALIESWLRDDPDNPHAHRYAGYIPSRRARQAWDREETERFRSLNNEALRLHHGFLQETADLSGLKVRFWNSWSFLRTALHARMSGDTDLADRLTRMVIDFHASQPPGALTFAHMQLAIANAALGHKTEAIDHLNALYEEGYYDTQLLASYSVFGDPYGIYHGIHKDVGFIDVTERMRSAQQQVLEQIRAELPHLFPKEGTATGVRSR